MRICEARGCHEDAVDRIRVDLGPGIAESWDVCRKHRAELLALVKAAPSRPRPTPLPPPPPEPPMALLTCVWPDCDRTASSRHLCSRDNNRARRAGGLAQDWPGNSDPPPTPDQVDELVARFEAQSSTPAPPPAPPVLPPPVAVEDDDAAELARIDAMLQGRDVFEGLSRIDAISLAIRTARRADEETRKRVQAEERCGSAERQAAVLRGTVAQLESRLEAETRTVKGYAEGLAARMKELQEVAAARDAALEQLAAREAEDDEAACAICGCTEDRACEGGCHWVGHELGPIDLCSACVTNLGEAWALAHRDELARPPLPAPDPVPLPLPRVEVHVHVHGDLRGRAS